MKLIRPLPLEIWTRENGEARIVHTFSPKQAKQLRAKFIEQGIDAAIYVGNLEVKR